MSHSTMGLHGLLQGELYVYSLSEGKMLMNCRAVSSHDRPAFGLWDVTPYSPVDVHRIKEHAAGSIFSLRACFTYRIPLGLCWLIPEILRTIQYRVPKVNLVIVDSVRT
jgi:hypothetical protein